MVSNAKFLRPDLLNQRQQTVLSPSYLCPLVHFKFDYFETKRFHTKPCKHETSTGKDCAVGAAGCCYPGSTGSTGLPHPCHHACSWRKPACFLQAQAHRKGKKCSVSSIMDLFITIGRDVYI